MLEVPVGFYLAAAGTRMARGDSGGGRLGVWGERWGAKKDSKKEEKVPPLSWMEDIFGVSFSLPRNLRAVRGGGRQMDGQGRCSSVEGKKDIDIFKSSDVFPFMGL